MSITFSAALLATALGAAPGDTLHLGQLDFTPCELKQPHSAATTEAYCSPFRVPENWDAPGGRKIDLHLAIIKSDASRAEVDPVVLLAGGPGQAATEVYAQTAGALAPLRKHRHIVLLDQRGTGSSNKLSCESEKKPEEAVLSQNDAVDLDLVRRDTAACAKQLADKADPRYYTTSDAARDLEALRVALGGVQYNLIGVSYGTRMGQQYTQRYPQGVRSLVIDGVVPNEMVLGQDFATDLDHALKAQFARCTADKACTGHFGDVYKSLYEVRAKLAAAPQKLTIRDPLTFEPVERTLSADGFSAVVRLYAYSPESAAMLPLGIGETAKGNLAPLLGQIKLLSGDLRESITAGMELSVICAEDADLLQERPEEKSLILGDEFVRTIKAQCEVWPKGKRPDDFHTPLKTDVPVLALSGEFDPVTPPRNGEQVIKNVTHGRHLVAPGQGHNVFGRGCMPKLMRQFVENPQPDKLDAGCLSELGPTPFFLDFNGASP
jgi:pimeloyl-ACP methyl ester carboxylesterase